MGEPFDGKIKGRPPVVPGGLMGEGRFFFGGVNPQGGPGFGELLSGG